MGFYDQTSYPTWSGPARTPPFESRPNLLKLDEPSAFNHQLEEVERAIDNLVKSGKLYAANQLGISLTTPVTNAPPRRDSVPASMSLSMTSSTVGGMPPRSPLSPLDPASTSSSAADIRMSQTVPAMRGYGMHSSTGDVGMRGSQSHANLHSYYASQRAAGQRTPDDEYSGKANRSRGYVHQQSLPLSLGSAKSDYNSNTTSNAGSASSSLILDTSLNSAPIDSAGMHSPLPSGLTGLSEIDDAYSSRRRRFRLGSASIEGLIGISEADLTPRGPATAGVIGSRTSPTSTFDPFATEFGAVNRITQRGAPSINERYDTRGIPSEQRNRAESAATRNEPGPGNGNGGNAESPSPRSATFSLFSSDSTTQTNNTTASSSPETSPLKTSKGSVVPAKIAPIGTKRSSGSLNSDNSDGFAPQSAGPQQSYAMPPSAGSSIRGPMSAPLQSLTSPRITTPTAQDDKWNVFSGGWGTPFVSAVGNSQGNNGANEFHSRSATGDTSNGQKGIWGGNTKGLGMTVGSGVDVRG